jgi:hypothetical protein
MNQLTHVARQITDKTGYDVNVVSNGNMHYVNIIKIFRTTMYESNDVDILVKSLLRDYKLV